MCVCIRSHYKHAWLWSSLLISSLVLFNSIKFPKVINYSYLFHHWSSTSHGSAKSQSLIFSYSHTSCQSFLALSASFFPNNNLLQALSPRQWHPTPVLSPGKSHGQRSLWAAVHGVAQSWTWLSNFTFTFHCRALEKDMATHSSVLAWRIPGTGEPGGLPSMGSHRVRHDWSDLAAAASSRADWHVMAKRRFAGTETSRWFF